MIRFLILIFLYSQASLSATIAIIDTGFDLDHEYLRPKIIKTESEKIEFQGWDFFDNSHLKRPVIGDKDALQDVLRYRNLRAKAHRQGLTVEEFEWYKTKNADKAFKENLRMFKKHSHGTFVAGIALREGDNIQIFPIRGLNIPNPVVAVEDSSLEGLSPASGRTPEEKFGTEIKQSLDRIARKFSKICRFVSRKNIEIVNASYGITYKSIMVKFRERYREITGKEIDEPRLKLVVDDYFRELFERGEKTMRRHPNILFVFSAGNSGLDNDSYFHYPSSIKVPNSITVAAVNGDYLATFSNFGEKTVDVGAPGVGIPSLLPRVYSENVSELYSPASGTSMAAPFVANLAAQIKNTNPGLTPPEIKRIILGTGTFHQHLKGKLSSAAIVDNNKALKAALLSKDISLEQAVSLGVSGLIPMEDKISIGLSPAVSPEELQKKVLEAFPTVIGPQEVDEEPAIEPLTKSASSSPKDQEKEQPDNSARPVSAPQDAGEKSADPVPSSRNEEQSPPLSGEGPASSSQLQPSPPEAQSPVIAPSSPQS